MLEEQTVFEGMLEERAGLVQGHGPAALCEKHGVSLHFVDLRWGITSSMREQSLTVKTCLDAIKDSDIFVGFYGQRYGASMIDGQSQEWLSPSLQLCHDDYPWLKEQSPFCDDGATTKKSVTHLEFEFGYNDAHRNVVDDDSGPIAAFAFFRDEQFDLEQGEKNPGEAWKYQAENAESRELLQNLKEDSMTWAKAGKGALWTYSTPQAFCKTALDELNTLLEKVLPEKDDTDILAQENHLRRLTFGYAGVEKYEMRIQEYIHGDDSRPLLVTSEPGGGKSALLANLVNRAKERSGIRFVACASHFIGVNDRSKELDCLLDGLKSQVSLRMKESGLHLDVACFSVVAEFIDDFNERLR